MIMTWLASSIGKKIMMFGAIALAAYIAWSYVEGKIEAVAVAQQKIILLEQGLLEQQKALARFKIESDLLEQVVTENAKALQNLETELLEDLENINRFDDRDSSEVLKETFRILNGKDAPQ